MRPTDRKRLWRAWVVLSLWEGGVVVRESGWWVGWCGCVDSGVSFVAEEADADDGCGNGSAEGEM